MPKDYDRIFRRKIKRLALPLMRMLFGMDWKTQQDLLPRLEARQEYEADYTLMLDPEDPDRRQILHVEFQAAQDAELPARMLSYFAHLHLHYKCPVVQVVIFLQERKTPAERQSTVTFPGIDTRHTFHTMYLHQISYKRFLELDLPEAAVLAVLGHFDGQPQEKVIGEIVQQLSEKGRNQNLELLVDDLVTLLSLRKIEPSTIEKIKVMTTIEQVILERVLQGNNPFFVKWAEKAVQEAAQKAAEKAKAAGVAEGKAKGKAEGKAEAIRQNITDLLERSPLSEQQIADILQVPLELVNEIRDDLHRQGRLS